MEDTSKRLSKGETFGPCTLLAEGDGVRYADVTGRGLLNCDWGLIEVRLGSGGAAVLVSRRDGRGGGARLIAKLDSEVGRLLEMEGGSSCGDA